MGIRVHKPKIKPRIHELKEYYGKDIERFDLDNQYPNNTIKVVNQSFNLKGCINLYTQFLFGSGLANNGDVLANDHENFNDIFYKVAMDYAIHEGAFPFIGKNALGEDAVVRHVPFQYVRRKKDSTDWVVYNNWDYSKYPSYQPEKFIYLQNYDPSNEINEEYRGQLYYISQNNRNYPLSKIDPIVEIGIADHLLAVKKLKRIENEFALKQIFLVPTQNTEDEYDESEEENAASPRRRRHQYTIQDQLNEFVGENGAELMALESDDMENPPFKSIPINQGTRENYEYEEESIRNQMISFFNQPLALRSVPKTGVVFSNEQIQEAYIYYNNVTDMPRRFLERKLNKLFDGLGLGEDEVLIKEFNLFGTQNTQEDVN